jgi:uncharacterized membrane protein
MLSQNQLTVSLWGDESFTAVAVQNNFSRMLYIVSKDTAPPLYYIFLFIWTGIFGNSEIAIRSLSVLLYLGTVFVAYLIAKKIQHKWAGILAALVCLANPFLFPFAFEGRMYAILVFFVTLSFYFFISKKTTGYIISSAAALYSHHYAALALIFQFLWKFALFIKNKQYSFTKAFAFIKPYLLIGLLYLPWLYPLYKQLTLVSTGFWLGKPKLIDIPLLYGKYLISSEILFPWQKYLIILPIVILCLKRWKKHLTQNLILLGWAIAPVLIAFLLSQGKTSLFFDRYLIFIIPSIALLLTIDYRKIILPLIIIFSIPLLYLNFYYFTHPTKRPFRELSQHIKQTTTENDFLINYNGSAHHLWETKYYGLEAPLYVPGQDLPYYVGTAQMTENDIIKVLPDKNKIGVISSEQPESMQINNYRLLDYQKFGELSFSWFIKNEDR